MGARGLYFFDRRWGDLAREFGLCARMSEIYLPSSLYNTYLTAYSRADAMQRQTLLVLGDGEHQLIMDEGRDFFKLPDTHALRKDLDELRLILDSFNPYHAPRLADGRVRLKNNQMDGFFQTFSKALDVTHESFEMFRNSDYLRLFRYLRDDRKVSYAGPTSLYELVMAYYGVARVYVEQSKYHRGILDLHHETLERKVESVMREGHPVIEFSSQGIRLFQGAMPR